MSLFVDTHIHLDGLSAPAAMVNDARQAGVGAWIVPGTTAEGWSALLAAVAVCPGAYAAPGIHPLAAGTWRPEEHLAQLRALAVEPGVVAIGEVGLDRLVAVSWARQEEVFVAMIRLALDLDLPLLLHARQATGRLLELLRRERAERVGGIFHAFSGSLATASELINLGFALGIGGVVTFPRARRLAEVVRQLPPEWLVLETDAPDQAPEPHRGQENCPAYLPLIAMRVAALRGWSLAETARVTTANACRILRIPQPDRQEEALLKEG